MFLLSTTPMNDHSSTFLKNREDITHLSLRVYSDIRILSQGSGTAGTILKWGLIIEAAQNVQEKYKPTIYKGAQNAHGRKSMGTKAPLAPSRLCGP